MKRFLTQLLKTSILFYVCFWAVQLIVDKGLRLSKNETYNEWSIIVKGEINADLVFLGSSRTCKHFNPKVFDQELKLNSYNLGNNGTALDAQKIKNETYFSHNKPPKVIIQNVDINSLKETKELYNKPQYFPYYNLKNYKVLSNIDPDITLEYIMPLYKYRGFLSVFEDAYKGYLNTSEINTQVYKGYTGSGSIWNFKFEKQKKALKGKNFDFSEIDFDKQYVVLENLVENLKSTNALVLLVWSPEYYERQELNGSVQNKVISAYKRIANKEKVIFLDFTKDSLCLSKDYFYDSYHLNNEGANLFSKKVSDSIKKYLAQ